MAVCGFMLGWQHTLFAFFIALVLGTCWGLYLRAKGKNKRGEPIAFGPALCAGVYIALLYGGDAIAWYIDLLIF
jgi:leader peptidase (prepilin peptidase)/N-methyltransferase